MEGIDVFFFGISFLVNCINPNPICIVVMIIAGLCVINDFRYVKRNIKKYIN
jgi:hypothetical protein